LKFRKINCRKGLTLCQPRDILKIVRRRGADSMFKAINKYFFGEEVIPVADAVIFYGMYAIGAAGAVIALLVGVQG